MDTPPLSDSESESDESLVTDRELQDAFSRGLLKPGLNVVLEGPKKAVNDVNGLKQCLAEFKRDLEWVERLDVTLGPVPEIGGSEAPAPQNKDQKAVDPEDDFQREMSLYVCFQMLEKLRILVQESGKEGKLVSLHSE
uniref:cDNA FLJ60526, highly similar to Probable rRNA-processing protein EBP2 n=1 Tax=Homo sapiens TaxID=9606 RepID=B4DHA6_HUMAN|nr:unnamed protein product [Homo sapiens]